MDFSKVGASVHQLKGSSSRYVLLCPDNILSSRSSVSLIDEAVSCLYAVLVPRGSKRCVLASRNFVKLRTTKGEQLELEEYLSFSNGTYLV